jgi:hypothetical protein
MIKKHQQQILEFELELTKLNDSVINSKLNQIQKKILFYFSIKYRFC